MSLQVEKMEHNMAKLTFEVSAEDFEKAIQAAYLKQRKSISVPGFRKGKVPRQMIEKMYGTEVFYDEAINGVLPAAYGKALEESELEVVSQPKIDFEDIKKGEPVVFTAEVATKPEVTLGEYKGLKVSKISTRVTAKEVDAEVEKEQEKNARTIEVTDRAVADKDEVKLNFEGFVDGVAFEGGKGEDYPLTIGSGAFIPGFEDQLIGAEIGKEMEVKVTFPEDYNAEELKGKEAVFKCTVNAISAKELPELDDEFASEVSEFETLDEYKADVKTKIKERKEAEGKTKQENEAVDKAIENATMDIPDAMIDAQVDDMLNNMARSLQQQGLTIEQYMQFTGMTQDKMKEDARPNAIKQIQTRLVLEAIAKAENIEIADEKIEEEIAKMAEAYGMEADKIKELMGDAEIKNMKMDMAVQEAVTLLVDNAVAE